MSSQNMSLWHIDYFGLKALKKQPVQERHSCPPLSLLKQETSLPCERYPPCTRMIEGILFSRDREFRAEKAVLTNLVTYSPFTTFGRNPFVLSIVHTFIVSLSTKYKSFLLWSLLWIFILLRRLQCT